MAALKELIQGLEVKKIIGSNGLNIEGIAYDSRQVKKDFLFVCIKGARADGHSFISDAKARGAKAFIVERASKINNGLTQLLVPDARGALTKLAGAFYGFPSRALKVVGVTGTDGKTTTTLYIKSILEEAGFKTGLVGTISYELGERIIPAERTTPEALDLQFFLSQMLKNGMSHAVMEVSSHGLIQRRVDDIDFKVAVFTNLSHEHLDFHKEMDEYFFAKKMLFDKDIERAVVNIDDEYGRRLAGFLKVKSTTFGTSPDASLSGCDITADICGTRYRVKGPGIETEVSLSIIGRHNVYNSLAAIGAALHFGIPEGHIKKGLERLTHVPGRFEPVKCGQPYTVIVDYAHTPRALENALKELRHLIRGRLILVFGCGGDRDPAKRPIMGGLALQLADYTIVTSDNPRSEDPSKIIQDIVSGMGTAATQGEKSFVEPDREKAIVRALNMACPGDAVLLAGKGHEKYQIIGNVYHPFDDVEKVKSILRK